MTMLAALKNIDFTVVLAFLLAIGGWFFVNTRGLKFDGIASLARAIADQAVEHALMGATGILDGITPQNAADKLDAWVWAELDKHGIAKNAALDMLIKPAIADAVARVLEGLRKKFDAEEHAGDPVPAAVAVAVAKAPQAGRVNIGLLLVIASVAGLAFGCAWFSKESKQVETDVVDCTKAEAAKAITEFGPLADAILIYATGGNGQVNTDAVKSAAKGFGKDIGGCVLADAVARAVKPAPVDPNAPKSSPLVSDPDSLRRALAAVHPGVHFHTANGDL